MQHVRIDTVPNAVQPAAVMRQLTGPLDCEEMALNYYELRPGDSFAFAYHSHEIQEEVFIVLEGTATWETEDGTTTVAAGEAIRIPPGEFQRGWNRSDERVRALALGAPLEYGDQPKYVECPECDDRTRNRIERVPEAEESPTPVRTVCEDCDTETGRWARREDGQNERVG